MPSGLGAPEVPAVAPLPEERAAPAVVAAPATALPTLLLAPPPRPAAPAEPAVDEPPLPAPSVLVPAAPALCEAPAAPPPGEPALTLAPALEESLPLSDEVIAMKSLGDGRFLYVDPDEVPVKAVAPCGT
jgi:hypothetical protein